MCIRDRSGDCGIIIERGDQNNAFLGWDESADKFTLATTTATGASTGDLTLTTGTLVANLEGTVTGNASSATVADGLQNTPNISVGTVTAASNITSTGTVSDVKGDLRKIPITWHNAATYTLQTSDAGKVISEASGGANITCDHSTFLGGDAVTIMNHTGSNITITQPGGMTIYNAADGSTGNRTLAGRGFCTIFFREHNVAYISGAGLS